MTQKQVASWSFVVASLLIAAGCGGSDADSSTTADGAAEIAGDDASTPDPASDEATDDATSDAIDDSTDDATDDATDDGGDVGFGELIEGSFIFSGAVDQQYFVSDGELAFRLGGGCMGGSFGFSVGTTVVGTDAPVAQLTAEMDEDLSGGATGEFEVDATVTLFAEGDATNAKSFDGPIRMIISEHDTGGLSSDLNARRMTVTLLGTMTSGDGDLDTDVTFRWVMGCP